MVIGQTHTQTHITHLFSEADTNVYITRNACRKTFPAAAAAEQRRTSFGLGGAHNDIIYELLFAGTVT